MVRFLKPRKPKLNRAPIVRDSALRRKVWDRDQGVCRKCHRFDPKWTHDHIVQLAAGGEDTLENSQTLCRKCVKPKDAGDTTARAKADRLAASHQTFLKRRQIAP